MHDDDQWAAVQRLAEQIRTLVAQMIGTGSRTGALESAATHVAAATAELAPSPRVPDDLRWQDNLLVVRPFSPVMGGGNPLAPPMSVQKTGDTVTSHITFALPYEGPPGIVHGGVLALVMDEFLGRAVMETGLWGMTSTLQVRYRDPVPVGQPLVFRGWVADKPTERSIRAIGTAAHVDDPDKALIEAEGLFVYPRNGPPDLGPPL